MKMSKLKDSMRMRSVAGTTLPRINSTSKAMQSAQKIASKAGWAGEEGNVEVDGGNAMPRLDRPGRKSGGKVDMSCYADGGGLKPGFIKHPGSLRKALGVKDGDKIPEAKLEKAEHSDNPKLRKRAILAETLRGWKKG